MKTVPLLCMAVGIIASGMLLSTSQIANGQQQDLKALGKQLRNEQQALERNFEAVKALAESGTPFFEHALGTLYWDGNVVPQNFEEAVKWYRRSAEHGYPTGQFFLADAYFRGVGVTQNYAEAFKWAKLAAQAGLGEAQGMLRLMYENGLGAAQDYVRAHMWYNLSAAKSNNTGQDAARNNRSQIAQSMTPQQIARAQDMARECQETNYTRCD